MKQGTQNETLSKATYLLRHLSALELHSQALRWLPHGLIRELEGAPVHADRESCWYPHTRGTARLAHGLFIRREIKFAYI